MTLRLFIAVATISALLVTIPAAVSADSGVVINETLISHSGTDDTEYVEFHGTPGGSLDGLSFIVVEGDAFDPGTIDRRFDFKPFHAIGPNGFFLFGNCAGLGTNYDQTPDASLFANYFENSSLTMALVETASVGGSSVTGDEVVVSAIAFSDGDSGDVFYFDAPVLGPHGSYFPAGGRRLSDGVDTGSTDDWEFADFTLPGENTPTGGGFDGCAPIGLTIPEIQGSGRFSDYAGEVAQTTGVVTLLSGNGSSCWIQDPAGDGDALTSDGIFVNGCAYPDSGPSPVVGDVIEIIATVEEQQYGNALPLTRLNDVDTIGILSGGNELPEPVVLTDLPTVSVPDGEAFWEPLEGMLVSVKNAPVVSPTSRHGEFAMLAKSDAKPGSGFFPQASQILLRSIGENQVDYNPERILVDDYTLDEAIQVMPGDRMRNLVGVVDYSFGNYKLQPASFDVKLHKLPKGEPVSKRSGPNGDTVITTFNVENLFDLENNPDKDDAGSTPTPAELEIQLTKLAKAIESELRLPEIMVLQEVENTEIAQELGNRVNASAGTNYVAVSFETSDGRGIEVAFLYDDDRVDLEEAFQLFGPDVEAAFGPASASPGREPLYGEFLVDGKTVHIVGNHFKSKGGDDPIFGTSFDRVTEVQRKMQAQVVRDFVLDLLDDDSKAMVMVTGDLNDFQFGEPDEGPNHPIAILEGVGGGPSFTNLINTEKEAERWTYLFDGNSQVLDHMLVNDPLLKRLAGMDILHFNAAFPSSLGADPTTALRASDHDAVEGRFTFGR